MGPLYTTCYARIKLYSEMCNIGKNLLYVDTDSYIYKVTPDAYKPRHGRFFGELTDELKGERALEFVSIGSKCYAIRTPTLTKMAFKGVTLNSKTRELINFSSMKDMVLKNLQNDPKITVEAPNFFVRDKNEGRVFMRDMKKTISFVYDKRDIDSDSLYTYPYGYRV